MKDVIKVKNLSVSYDGITVVDDVSFTLDEGKLIGIIGPNGAGKSSLLKAMLSLIPRDRGRVTFSGKKMREIKKKIAYIQQRADIDWDFPILVKDVVLLGTYPRLGLFRRPSKEDRNFALQCLEKVGMDSFAQKQIGQLSGGQQQRVFLARALAQRADYFFLDEPFVGVDVTSEREIIHILKEIRDAGKTICIVHHDLTKVNEYFDQLLLLNKKVIAYGDVNDVYTAEHMGEAYNLHLQDFPRKGATP